MKTLQVAGIFPAHSSFISPCAGNILPHVGRCHRLQEYFLHISNLFLHMQEDFAGCRNISCTFLIPSRMCRKHASGTCRKISQTAGILPAHFKFIPAHAGSMLPTRVGNMVPALWKVQEDFYQSGSILLDFHPHFKKYISYLH